MAKGPDYRLYRFDRFRHIVGCKILICYGDHDAIAKARSLAAAEPQELWSGDRLLAIIEAQRAA